MTAQSQSLLPFGDRPGSVWGGGGGTVGREKGGECDHSWLVPLQGGQRGQRPHTAAEWRSLALTSRMPRLLSSLSPGSTLPVRKV